MKRSELRMLVDKYRELTARQKANPHSARLEKKRKEIERRYLHETGTTLESDLE